MRKFKNTFEKEIAKQIIEREITPSRNLWEEICDQKDNSKTKKSKINYLLVAACFLIIAGLFFILNNSSGENDQIHITKTPATEKTVDSKLVSHQNSENENVASIAKTEVKDQSKLNRKDIDENVDFQTSNKELIIAKNLPELNLKKSPDILSHHKLVLLDSVAQPKSKRKYVDAATLLFSVEHKDVIEKSKEGSNVATIDLNSK